MAFEDETTPRETGYLLSIGLLKFISHCERSSAVSNQLRRGNCHVSVTETQCPSKVRCGVMQDTGDILGPHQYKQINYSCKDILQREKVAM